MRRIGRRIAALQTLATVLSLWEHNRLSCAFPSVGGGPEGASKQCRPITINWSDLEIAFERNSPDQESFLDLENGDLLAIIEGEPDAAARRAKVANNPGRYLRVDPASSREQYRWMERFVASVVRPGAARAAAGRHRRQGRVPPLQGRAAGVPGRARALVHLPLGPAALSHPDLARAHADRGGQPAALGPGRAAGGADRAAAADPLGRGARARSCAARPATCWTRSPRPSCPRRWCSSSSCASAAPARCWPRPPPSATSAEAKRQTLEALPSDPATAVAAAR